MRFPRSTLTWAVEEGSVPPAAQVLEERGEERTVVILHELHEEKHAVIA